jgi:YidC/Oxa1 family membrane protein insertase
MTDIRRSILWVIFGFSMVLIWDKWQLHNGKQATFFPQASHQQAAPAAGAQGAGDVPTASAPGGATSALPTVVAGAPAVPHVTQVIRSDVLKLTFDTEGGSLVGADLLAHKQATLSSKVHDDKPLTLLTQTADHIYVAQTGLIGATGSALPTHKTPMTLVSTDTELKDGQDTLTVRFESADVGGVKLVKTYTLHRGGYEIDVKHEVINTGTTDIAPQLYMQLVRDGSKGDSQTPFYSTFTGPAVFTQEAKYQKIEFAKIDKKDADFIKTAPDGYVAMVQHYFASAWLLGDGIERDFYAEKVPETAWYRAGMKVNVGTIAPGQTKAIEARLFVGPQAEKILEKVAPGLVLVKDYGWLTVLAKPLYWLLEKIHSFVSNWGWSIVLLVVMLKAAFYWLNAMAYRSMAKMKAINPRITEMRARLKDNPQQMQMEMMKIYREEKVNPMGGCFPVMIQIPVFIALYWVLLSSVEMRNAPWAMWISDLSSPDPYFILPLVMAVTTLIQTSLNPLPPDPMQAKLMWIMPMAFSVMFFFFPSGLVMYWVTNNTLTILQQAYINRSMGVKLKFSMPKFT